MKDVYIKRFAALFTVLLIFQECNGLLKNHLVQNVNEAKDVYHDGKSAAVAVSRQKRAIFGGILIGLSIASAGIDIYKQVRGCKEVTPELEPKIEQAKRMQKNLISYKDSVNLAWVPAESKEVYAQRLASDMVVLRESITFFKATLVDILKLLDQNILDEMNRLKTDLENDIENNKDVGVENFEQLEQKFFTKTQFALSLTFKLLPVAFLGGKFIYSKIVKNFARETASDWAQRNPGKVKKMLGNAAERAGKMKSWTKAKINSFKNGLKAKWGSFKAKYPRFTNGLNKLTSSRFGQFLSRNMGKIKAGCKALAKGLVVALFVGIEIWNLVKFINGCKENLKKVNNAIESLSNGKKELDVIKSKIDRLQRDADKYWGLMKGNITSDGYLNVVAEVAKLGENAKDQTTEIVKASKEIRRYVNEIKNAGVEKTDDLNKMVISAFRKINYKLDCLYSKTAIVADLIDNCAIGWGKNEELYKRAKDKQKKITDDCIKGKYMDKNEVLRMMRGAMELKKKQTICIRNNPAKKTIVCEKWYDDVSNSDILKVVSDLTLDDVKYMISVCPPAEVSQKLKDEICMKKNQDLITVDEIRKQLHKYNQYKVAAAYFTCQLSSSSVNDICNSKKSGYDFNHVYKKYNVFSDKIVKTAFDGCKKETNITPFDLQMICTLKNIAGLTIDSKGFDNYRAKYDLSALKRAYDQC